jgi:hypothetical protein
LGGGGGGEGEEVAVCGDLRDELGKQEEHGVRGGRAEFGGRGEGEGGVAAQGAAEGVQVGDGVVDDAAEEGGRGLEGGGEDAMGAGDELASAFAADAHGLGDFALEGRAFLGGGEGGVEAVVVADGFGVAGGQGEPEETDQQRGRGSGGMAFFGSIGG